MICPSCGFEQKRRNKMHKCPFLTIALLSAVFSVVCTGCGKLNAPMPDSDLVKYQGCMMVSDCVYVNNGCCDCANGGEEIAINSTMALDFLAQFDCRDVSCTLIARTPECGSGLVSCENQLCNYQLP